MFFVSNRGEIPGTSYFPPGGETWFFFFVPTSRSHLGEIPGTSLVPTWGRNLVLRFSIVPTWGRYLVIRSFPPGGETWCFVPTGGGYPVLSGTTEQTRYFVAVSPSPCICLAGGRPGAHASSERARIRKKEERKVR